MRALLRISPGLLLWVLCQVRMSQVPIGGVLISLGERQHLRFAVYSADKCKARGMSFLVETSGKGHARLAREIGDGIVGCGDRIRSVVGVIKWDEIDVHVRHYP